jgi:CheY-like chemotaxis protein
MPVLDGLEFLERQRQLPASYQQALTVVVLSAAHETRERALAVEVKIKPLDITELATLLLHYLPQALPAASWWSVTDGTCLSLTIIGG